MNILIISPGNICEPTGGATSRVYNLADRLQKNSNKIIVLEPMNDGNKKLFCKFEMYTYSGKPFIMFCDINPFFIFKLAKLMITQEIDIIQVEHPWNGVSIARIICKVLKKRTKIIYDAHNYQKKLQIYLNKYYKKSKDLKLTSSIFLTITTQYVKIAEKLAVRLSDFILCVSNNNRLAFIHDYNTSPDKIKVIPNGTDFQKIRRSSRNKKKYGLNESKVIIIFHGSYAYPPNFEAIKLIENKISVKVKKYTTEAEFIIAGADVPISNKHPSVKFLGFVEDIYTLLKSSDIAIAPIVSGEGTKLKVLDYLGSGLPIVTTRKGIEGINAKNGEHAIVVDDVDDEFVDAIKYLMNNEKERKRIGANARKLAEEEYDWDKIGKKLDGLYRNIITEFPNANK